MFFNTKDDIFDQGHWQTRFTFDANVAAVFDDMALRSIPMYREVMESLSVWANAICQPGAQVLDLGCSTGNSLVACMAKTPADRNVSYRGIDSAHSMIDLARTKTAALYPDRDCEFETADIRSAELGSPTVVILNYTLQFIPPTDRLQLLRRIFDAIAPGGMIFLSEKLAIKNPQHHDVLTAQYHQFKQTQGYSQLAIERKRQALDNVLVPITFEEQLELLISSGFTSIEVPVKWNQFCTFVGRRKS